MRLVTQILFLTLVLVLPGCSSSTIRSPTPIALAATAAPTPAALLEPADPGSLGLSLAALEEHQRLCETTDADACLVLYKERIVQEWYSNRYEKLVPLQAWSSTKSIVSLLVGMLIDDRNMKSIDEPVCLFIGAWCAGDKSKVTIRQLLNHTSGMPVMSPGPLDEQADVNTFVIGLPLDSPPGTKWYYSSPGVQLLSPILDKVAGEPIQDYARKRLFEPLGMKDTKLAVDSSGHALLYAHMTTTPRDLARIGVLMKHKGMWRGQRIFSERWFDQIMSSTPMDSVTTYGLLWWLYRDPSGFAAKGSLDNNLYVFPERDLIVVRMQAWTSATKTSETGYEQKALPLFKTFIR